MCASRRKNKSQPQRTLRSSIRQNAANSVCSHSGECAYDLERAKSAQAARFHQKLTPLAPGVGVQIAKQAVVVQFHAGEGLNPQDYLVDAAIQGCWQLPAPRGAIEAGREQRLAIGAEAHVANRAIVGQ